MKKLNIPTVMLLAGLFLCQNAMGQNQAPFRFGINFPYRSPEAAALSTYLPLLNETGAAVMRQMTYADVHWQQIEINDGEWNFTYADSSILNSYGIQSVPTLYGISAGENDTIGLQVPWLACSDPGCGWQVERDSAFSRNYVQTVVNHYKPVVKYWEVSNEMASKMHRPIGLPMVDYVEFMQLNYQWIKSADPQAVVVLPGLLGTCGVPLEGQRDWLRSFLENGGLGTFEIMNYHDYNSWWTLPGHLDSLMAVMADFGIETMPIWCTESSISSVAGSEITPAYSSVDQQAADVWRRSALLLGKGLQTYFWQSMWSSGYPSEWQEFGLLNFQGKKKKSFYSYQLLVEKMDHFDTAEILSLGTVNDDNASGGEGVWVVQFNWPDGTRRWVAWSPDGQSYNLQLDSEINNVTVTTVVPNSLPPDGQSAVFAQSQIALNQGAAQLSLSSIPVLIEVAPAIGVLTPERPLQNFQLYPSYPNPFNTKNNTSGHSAIIRFSLFHPGQIRIKVFNQIGQEVITLFNGYKNNGNSEISWDGKDKDGHPVVSGVYYFRLEGEQHSQTGKMILLR